MARTPPPSDGPARDAPASERAVGAARIDVCGACGTVQRVPPPGPGQRSVCRECEVPLPAADGRTNDWAAATAAAALLLFPMAILLPILEVERFGVRHEASVWSGSVALVSEGALLAGIAVFVCSVLAPPLKLVGLMLLCHPPRRLGARGRARLLRVLDHAGRWGMLDVLLVALLVAGLKLGDVVRVTPGPGAVAFTLVVVASLVAAALFDPRAARRRAAGTLTTS